MVIGFLGEVFVCLGSSRDGLCEGLGCLLGRRSWALSWEGLGDVLGVLGEVFQRTSYVFA